MEEQKFSILAYAHQWRESGEGGPTEITESKADEENRVSPFVHWVEEIRGELASPRGRSDEERQQYGEMLNRAVLGYEEDRFRILMIIQDQLAKRRLLDLQLPDPRYGTLAEAVFAEIIGLNFLELVLKRKDGLEEIQVVGINVFEVRDGISVPSAVRLSSVKDLERIQQNLVLFNGDTLNPRKRWAEVMLRDGTRVTMTGFGFTSEPTLTLRFFSAGHFQLPLLVQPQYSTISALMKDVLLCLIRSYFNLVVTGPTNTGKTNLIKALIGEMPPDERIVTIESRLELMLKRDYPHRNIIEYETDGEDVRHSGQQAFKLALRQSPKRICHAEIRDEDANIYVRACTRGHEGSLTSVHVNELEDVPEAIADMCMMDGRGMNPERLVKRITRYVANIGLEMALVNGKRKLVRIGEFEFRNGEVLVRDIVRFNYERNEWEYPLRFSGEALQRMRKYDPSGLATLMDAGGNG